MKNLIDELRKCWQKRQSARYILGKYGIQHEDDLKKSLGIMNKDQAVAQVLNWITSQMACGETTEIRLTDPASKTVYTVCLSKWKGTMKIKNIKPEPTLTGKILHHWSNFITYETLSLFEIKASFECADVLNSFNEDILDKKIDDLVNEAIELELPNGCTCDCCIIFGKNEQRKCI